MTDQQKNPEVDKEKEAFASDESLLPNNEMKPEKRVGNSVNTFYCSVFSHCLSSFTFISCLCIRSMGYCFFVFLGCPYYLLFYSDYPLVEWKSEGQ